MNLIGITHEAKSNYAYAYKENTLHLRLRTVKDDIESVELVWGDPFMWTRGKWLADQESGSGMTKVLSDDWYDYWFIEIHPKFKRTRYGFVLKKDRQSVFWGAHGPVNLETHPEATKEVGDFFNFPYINVEDLYQVPEWVKDTVWYQIFPERFSNGDAGLDLEGTLAWGSQKEVTNEMHFGGDLQGIINQLPYIAELGVNGIYFTPIFEAKSTHKYDTIDYYKIDPSFGSNALFGQLVEKAHALGIRVVLDAVFNHCGIEHPYFQEVLAMGKASPYYDYFHMNESGYETFAFTPKMPKWRTGNPDVEAYLMDVASYWIEHYDIDGWRLDVSNEVSHEFWRKFRKRVKSIKPDCFILGENWDRSEPWLRGDQFDSVMNYEFAYPVWRLLDDRQVDYGVHAYRNSISKLLMSYPMHVTENLFNLIDSHDTSRIKTRMCGHRDKVKMAFALLLTYTGTPSIYYGSEVGLSGVDDGNRQCMIWDENKQDVALKAFVKKLISLRHEWPAFKSSQLNWLDIEEAPQVLAFDKLGETGRVYFYFNVSDSSIKLKVKARDPQVTLIDLMRDEAMDPAGRIQLEPWNFVLLGESVAR